MSLFSRNKSRQVSALIILAVTCAACTTLPNNPKPAPASASPTPAAARPSPTGAPSPTQPAGRIQSPGADWKSYTDPALGISFAYPPEWQEITPGSFEAGGGFAWSEIRVNDGAGPGAVCQGEANREKPQSFGAYPEIQDTTLGTAAACLILPSADQPKARRGEALYLLWPPSSVRPNALWALHADADHIIAIVKSLRLSQAAAQPETSHCGFQSQAMKANTYRQGGLRIDEFPVAPSTGCSPYLEAEGFNKVASAGAPAAAAAQVVSAQFTYSRLSQINQRLAPFGYQVQVYSQTLFRVLKGGKVLRSNLFWIGQLTVNASGTDFILPVVDSYNSLTLIVRADGIHPVENWDLLLFDNIFPVFVGDDQISLAYDDQRIPRPTNNPALVQVKKNGQVIDTFSVDGSTPSRGPVRGLWAWEDHWLLELPGLLIQDGLSLNDQLGYSEMFTWRLLKGQPFYFFRKDGQIHSAYDGQTLPVTYDEVIHTPQWNTSMLLELKAYDSGLLFFARRGDTWYYVVLRAETA